MNCLKTLWLNNLKTKTTMNAKIFICVEAVMYLLYNLNDCTFNPFALNAPFLYPLKTSEKLRYSHVFRG